MCYDNSLKEEQKKIEKAMNSRFYEEGVFKPIYHAKAFSNPAWPVITDEFPDVIQMYHWGLIPKWIKGMEEAEKIRTFTYNAKSETVFEKPSFAASIKYSRCLVLSSGFFEWKHEGKNKIPHFISLKNEPVFAMAGIWSNWVHKETGNQHHTFSILTTEANPLMAEIHNTKKRMPLILPRELEKEWLGYQMPKEDIEKFFVPFDENLMQAHKISKLITSRTENSNVPEVMMEIP